MLAAERRRWGAPDTVALLSVLLLTAAVFHGVVRNGFLNWDDDAALVRNPALDGPSVLAWAFTTDHMSHYQPLAWLAWAGVRRLSGSGAEAHHRASLAMHVLNAGLVFALAWRMASSRELAVGPRRAAALAAALFFAVHPLRVEPVAWASAFPYLLALAPLLVSVMAYLTAQAGGGLSHPWLALSLLAYGVSLLCRAAAPGLPLVLLALDFVEGRIDRVGWRRALIEKLPYALLAVLVLLAEARTRDFAALERVGLVARAADAAAAPIAYLLRTAWPVGLSPLDVQPLAPSAVLPALLLGLVLLAVVTVLTWRLRARRPTLWGAWLAYLLLLAPASGLAPSGLQATADRYTYLPGVPVALLVGAGAACLWAGRKRRPLTLVLGLSLASVLAWASGRQVGYWRDSVTLWTRAVELNERNDVARYNLALALAERGDEAAAAGHYRRVLELIPDHGPGRHNLDLLEAARFEREAGAAAASGRLTEAVALYGRALDHDPRRLHSRRSRGMALAQLGRFDEAIPDLRAAVATASVEPAVVLALQFALERTGHADEAAALAGRRH